MTTIGEALDRFDADWIAAQPVTPRTAYRRTVRLFGFHLERRGIPLEAPLERLGPDDLRGFVRWHHERDLADGDEGSRKVAVHVARLGAFLAASERRADLSLDRDALRALVSDGGTA
jgi:hypothetical protein